MKTTLFTALPLIACATALTTLGCSDDSNGNTGGTNTGGSATGGGPSDGGGVEQGGSGGSVSDGGSGGAVGDGGSGGSVGEGGAGGGTQPGPEPGQDWSRDIVSTGLHLDLTTMEGIAAIVIAGSTESEAASFEIGDLEIIDVVSPDFDAKFDATTHPGQLDVGVPAGTDEALLVVQYRFQAHDEFDGWMPESGLSFLWPTFCGNLFPCKSATSDGVEFTMDVTGAPAGATVVYPASIPTAAPSYMPAIAVGNFTKVPLGTTTSGTSVNVWHLPGQSAEAAEGTQHLVEVFDFYETTYGPYPFGGEVGSVSADWGPGAYGGMEHHPYWHVARGSLSSQEVNAHEAAHGWFGDGVRIACWEDFVLSEGTASYLAAHALEEAGVDVWADYECELKTVCDNDPSNGGNTIALPGTCNAIDILSDPLWSSTPYMKGAYFFKAVADAIGADTLDTALSAFFHQNVGQAATMQGLIDIIKSQTDANGAAAVDALANSWLHTVACPVDVASLCQ